MIFSFTSAAAMPAGLWRWPHFDPAKEWADKTDGTIKFDDQFLDELELLRTLYGDALPINSGYRSPAHNAAMADHTDDGPHTTGAACDVSVPTAEAARRLVAAAIALGFRGIGTSVKNGTPGPYFVHLDNARTTGALWSY